MNKRLAAAYNLLFSSTTVVLSVVTGLVLVPLYLRRFDAATYGAWLASGNILAMIGIFESGLSSIVTQRLAAAYSHGESRDFARIAGAGIFVAVIMGALVASVGMLSAPFIVTWVHAPAVTKYALKLAVTFSSVGAGLSIVFYTLGAIPQAWQRTAVPGLLGVTALLASISSILLGLHFGLGVAALGLGPMISAAVYIIGYSIYLLTMWRRQNSSRLVLDLRLVVDIAKASSLLLASRIAAVLGGNMEAAVAAIFVSPLASAILVLTGRVITLNQMFMDRIGSAVFAGVAHVASDPKSKESAPVVTEITLLATSLAGFGLALAIALSRPVICLWVGPTLFGGRPLLLLIATSAAMSFRRSLFSNFTIAAGEIRKAVFSLLAESAVRAGLLISLAYLFKLPGIPTAGAVASIVAMILFARILAHRFNQSAVKIHQPGSLGFLLCITIGVVWMFAVPEPKTWIWLVVQIIMVGTLLLATLLTVERGTLISIKHSVTSMRSGSSKALQTT